MPKNNKLKANMNSERLQQEPDNSKSSKSLSQGNHMTGARHQAKLTTLDVFFCLGRAFSMDDLYAAASTAGTVVGQVGGKEVRGG